MLPDLEKEVLSHMRRHRRRSIKKLCKLTGRDYTNSDDVIDIGQAALYLYWSGYLLRSTRTSNPNCWLLLDTAYYKR